VIRNLNLEPNAMILPTKALQTIAKWKESTGHYLEPPRALDNVQLLDSNQIPTNIQTGSTANTTEIYAGQWEHLLIGMRQEAGFGVAGDPGEALGPQVRVLRERFADLGLVGLLCYLRADVQLAHPQAFNVLTGVIP
jgi:predicted phage gp36 major capsid-like protein